MSTVKPVILVLFAMLLAAATAVAEVPQPSEVFGFEPGADYKLADWEQMQEYFHRLARESDRVQIKEIGKTALGRPMLLLFISSEENLQRLEHWRSISEQLARARIDAETAETNAKEGKAILWIDAGLHGTEIAPGQMMPLLAHRVATEETPEMQKIRDNVILLLMPNMNPDGLDIVTGWYRKNVGTPFETTRPPTLYHHYVGHDNNRDWFMNNMPETKAVSRVIYNEWYPQIVYNHHQTGPAWARIFVPPFNDPVNPRIHPGVTTGVNIVGSAMANRFAMKGMGGFASDTTYSMWWNGGMRTVPYYHNMIGILTETSHATPTPRFYDPEKMPKFIGRSRRGTNHPTSGTNIFYPLPWQGGDSHLKDAVSYAMEASMAVLNIGSNLRQQWLTNIYQMGRDAIEKGQSGPFAYVISADQWDHGEAVNLVNIMMQSGVEVSRARAAFGAGGKQYPAGSFVIHAAQAFRPYVVDLLEKQEYPDRRQYPGGPPEAPYDLAGWTLPWQMGVAVDRVDGSFDASVEKITGKVLPTAGTVAGDMDFGFVLSHKPNATVRAVNRLLKDKERIFWARGSLTAGGQAFDAGAIVIEANGKNTKKRVEALSKEMGLDFVGIQEKPSVELAKLKPAKIGLYKSWVANMDEGWTRWILEDYEFDIESLHNEDILSTELAELDAIILPAQSATRILSGHAPGTMPEEYVGGLGAAGTMALKRYVEQGGTLVAFDGACDFVISQFGLPVRNVVSGVSYERFFIPGSLIRTHVDASHPLAYGMQKEVAAAFQRSRAFDVVKISGVGEGGEEDIKKAPAPPVDIVASYADKDILMSGWALGAKRYIAGKAAVVEVDVGSGSVVLFAFRPQFRAQPRGTYKLMFNALQGATIDDAPKATN
jgi:hypothetical protein